MSLQPKGLPEIPAQTVAVARAAFPRGTLAMRLRDRLAEVFVDEPFTGAFGRRGRRVCRRRCCRWSRCCSSPRT
ncbi:hypothetical protein MXD62_26800 [Frankia sp. Mgl5]|uniref:hypothetical protein n=1 Tax=Frankia sp. Mgl5 TaxID=2933793 RepID=UPI00200E3538|nr:hypothetical protein [Frankia sp. Mgl5]MCK9930720.1 hypothetical protein [Frankia sp. Mgl5]